MPQSFARKRSTFRCYRQKLYGYTKNKSRFCAGFAQTRKRPMPSAVVGSGNRTSPRPAPDRPGGAPNSSRRHQRQGFPYGGVCSSMRSDTHANIFSGAPPHLPKRRRYGWGTPSALRVKDPIVRSAPGAAAPAAPLIGYGKRDRSKSRSPSAWRPKRAFRSRYKPAYKRIGQRQKVAARFPLGISRSTVFSLQRCAGGAYLSGQAARSYAPAPAQSRRSALLPRKSGRRTGGLCRTAACAIPYRHP